MAALFLVSAYLQLNDPDPFAWVIVYVAAAGISIVHGYVGLPRSFLYVAASASGLVSVFILLGIEGIDWRGVFGALNMEGEGVEEIREVGGLLIIALWLSILAWLGRWQNQVSKGD